MPDWDQKRCMVNCIIVEQNKKTISIRVSGLKNYCPIFYGISRNWVETEGMFEYF